MDPAAKSAVISFYSETDIMMKYLTLQLNVTYSIHFPISVEGGIV